MWALLLALACGPRTHLRSLDTPTASDFDDWLGAEPSRAKEYTDFVALLHSEKLDRVVPPAHLWRQGTDWRTVQHPPYAAPPRALWPAMLPTLRLLRDEVIPLVGPIVVVSGFRTAEFNAAAGGAPGSRHKNFEAVDLVPRLPWTRARLHRRLLAWWTEDGPALQLGLGLYAGTRFHVDAWKHRRW